MEIDPKPTIYNLGGKGYNLHLLNKISDVPDSVKNNCITQELLI